MFDIAGLRVSAAFWRGASLCGGRVGGRSLLPADVVFEKVEVALPAGEHGASFHKTGSLNRMGVKFIDWEQIMGNLNSATDRGRAEKSCECQSRT